MTQQISDDQVAFRSASSTNSTLDAWLNLRFVEAGAWAESQSVAIGAAAQFVLVDSGFLAGNLSVGTATTTDGYVAAELAGAVGTASTNAVTNSGDTLNLVPIRDATSHREIQVSNNTVYGLLQCANGVSDGTAIAANGSENTQLSFVTIDSAGALQLATPGAVTIEFAPMSLRRIRNLPDFWSPTEPTPRPVLGAGSTVTARTLTVTTAFSSGETINLSTGAGTTGVSTVSSNESDTITLAANATAFNQDHSVQVYLNGILLTKGGDVTWISTTSVQINKALHINEELRLLKTA